MCTCERARVCEYEVCTAYTVRAWINVKICRIVDFMSTSNSLCSGYCKMLHLHSTCLAGSYRRCRQLILSVSFKYYYYCKRSEWVSVCCIYTKMSLYAPLKNFIRAEFWSPSSLLILHVCHSSVSKWCYTQHTYYIIVSSFLKKKCPFIYFCFCYCSHFA